MTKTMRPLPLLFVLIIIFLSSAACRLPPWSNAPATTPPPEAKIPNQRQAPTPTPFAHSTLREAWEMAKPKAQQWAADATPSEQWSCWGTLTPDGQCNYWYSTLVSASKGAAAELKVQGQGVEVSEITAAPQTLARMTSAPLAINGAIDSPEAVRVSMAWLESRRLKQVDTRLKSLAIWYPSLSSGCPRDFPVYEISFRSPEGTLCLSLTGEVVGHSKKLDQR